MFVTRYSAAVNESPKYHQKGCNNTNPDDGGLLAEPGRLIFEVGRESTCRQIFQILILQFKTIEISNPFSLK